MGRDKRNENAGEHWTKMNRPTMETAAWRSLSPYAQALYPWLKLEWRGPRANNNGRIRFSVRQAAGAMGINRKTAAKAFRELQAKGFLVCVEPARLGLGGAASSPAYELTELQLATSAKPGGRALFKHWSPGQDFPVYQAPPQNPLGANGQSRVNQLKAVK